MKAWTKGGIIGLIVGIFADISIVYLIPAIIGEMMKSQKILEMSCFSCIYTDYIRLLIFIIVGMIIGIIIGALIDKKGEKK
ncbi:hypothetical protein J4218_05755 [Candidatus Pacearchaeota archaeon]|nr:hypothetical protein [Candidatus Pacearchaeota archaeon]